MNTENIIDRLSYCINKVTFGSDECPEHRRGFGA